MHPTSLLCFILPVFSPLATGLSDFEIVTPIADHAVHVNETDDGRIVGGYETTISEYPHQISLRYRGHHRCGGSIISEEWIVTAAHCVDGTDSGMLSIKAGSSFLKGRDGQIRAVRRYLIHDDFSAVNLDGDIALIQLVTPLVFGSKVRPIELTWNDWAEGDAVVTGWGVTESSGGASSKLRAVKVPLISNRLCATLYKRRPITERMICAGYVGIGGRDACQGDSGGPMVMDDNLVGIVSWGIGCAKPHYPGVYTRVAAFRTWIQEETDI